MLHDDVLAERAAGRTWQAVADGLTADSVSTACGGSTWRVSSVQAVRNSQRAADLGNVKDHRHMV